MSDKCFMVFCHETVFYAIPVMAENKEEAQFMVRNFYGDWDQFSYDGEDFTVQDIVYQPVNIPESLKREDEDVWMEEE